MTPCLVLLDPATVVPDLSTRGALLRYARLRDAGLSPDVAVSLADSGHDVIGYASLEGVDLQ